MWPMPIVSVQPLGQMSGSFVRCQVGPSVGPFAQRGLDEALGLAIGFWRVGFGAQVLDFEQAQCLGVTTGSEADAVVGHDALNLNAMGPEEAQRVKEKAQAGATFLVGQDFRVGHAGVVVDRQMQIFPADPAAVALALSIGGDSVGNFLEKTQSFYIGVGDLSRDLSPLSSHPVWPVPGRQRPLTQ